jgi:hypothetical protein
VFIVSFAWYVLMKMSFIFPFIGIVVLIPTCVSVEGGFC